MANWVDELLNGNVAALDHYLATGGDINDLDPYGFTPLIEATIMDSVESGQYVLAKGADVNKPDATGRTALHWTTDNNNLAFSELLLQKGANPNAFTRAGQPVLVYPLLRQHNALKEMLYRFHASLPFAQDFINAKLIGHRFQLTGDVDIINAEGEFIEVDYEGFILEFTVEVIRHSLARFKNNYAAKHMRRYFNKLQRIINAFEHASQLLRYQHNALSTKKNAAEIKQLLSEPLLFLPVAYQGHGVSFMLYGEYLIKCDRGENALREGSVNIYQIQNRERLTIETLGYLLFKRQTEQFIHHELNKLLGLKPLWQMPFAPQISGNCSWANIECSVAGMYLLLLLEELPFDRPGVVEKEFIPEAMQLYQQWHIWDQDRALNECIQSFHEASPARKASKAATLGSVLFQSCKYGNKKDTERAEKILSILTLKDYNYILKSYLQIYYLDKKTPQGLNLLNILDDCGVHLEGIDPSPSRHGGAEEE